jgi:hypothetical protein
MTFENALRPDSNNNCPDEYVKCSENTTKDTTICIREGEEDLCPINDVSFTAESHFDYEL